MSLKPKLTQFVLLLGAMWLLYIIIKLESRTSDAKLSSSERKPFMITIKNKITFQKDSALGST